jgi:Asp-tRNA(Asn)/Glu-tRNA(Gln) amidotransferase A subunit family amidase
MNTDISRKDVLKTMVLAAATAAVPATALGQGAAAPAANPGDVTLDDLKSMEKLFGVQFSDEERRALLASVRASQRGFEAIRQAPIDYRVDPAVQFRPIQSTGAEEKPVVNVRTSAVNIRRPANLEDLAFASVAELGHLVRSRQVSPVELTEMYLSRLKRYGDKLLCVVALLEDRAMVQARRAEEEIRAGRYRGPLHGIPYGIKDIFATRGYVTGWGAEPFADQVFDYDATVVRKLEAAGAIILAKLSVGALAMGDQWYRGRTKNPWNPAQGSSGSSAGSASATAAGLVAFSIGTETMGSIVSPSHQCRVTGFRPTFGRVSRHGAMGLAHTMDKVGPICRYAEDCALVFAAILGQDLDDPSTISRSFRYDPRVDWKRLKIGFLVDPKADLADRSALDSDEVARMVLEWGARVDPIKFEPAPQGMSVILGVEASSAFDEFTRGDKIHQLKNSSWPQTFRSARYVPAVEYLQAMRVRSLAMARFEEEFADFDLVLAPGTGGYSLFLTNYTGHPQVLIPMTADERNNGRSRSLVGRLYDEGRILAVARAIQEATAGYRTVRPDLSKL